MPEHVLELIAAVADPAGQLGGEPRLEPLQQRDRVVGEPVPVALAAVVAMAAQLLRLGDLIDRAPRHQLGDVLREQRRVVLAQPAQRLRDPRQHVLVQRRQLVIAPEQQQRVEDGEVPGRALGREHRRDAPAEPARQHRRAAVLERRGAGARLGRAQPSGRRAIVRVVERAAIIDAIRAAVVAAPGARAALDAVLDRRERTGRLPRQLTVDADAASLAALRAVFSPRAVVTLPSGRARLDLGQVRVAALDELLYAALDRAPRDPAAERARLGDALRAALAAIPSPAHPAARAFLAAEREDAAAGRGDTWQLAERDGVARAAAVVADVAVALAAVLALPAPIRLANFAARVLGDSKALLPGTERARRLGEALLLHDVATQADVAISQPSSLAASAAAALEVRGLLRDDAGVLVHVFGPLTYGRGAAAFDHVARHAVLGDASPLSAAQLRDATLVALPARRITIFENQAPFLDYLERADPRTELVIFARGQASWATIMLLRLCAPAGLPVRHAGDLDRSGVLILRSLARRARLAIAPWHMDVATHRRFAAAGRGLDADERVRLDRLLAVDDPALPGHALLREIHATGRWIEQEAFSHLLLTPDSTPASGTATHDEAG